MLQDAHNCILDFDENTAMFAVYDGHGGHEVAQYCSEHLPQYIKDSESYKGENLEEALVNSFLGFDGTIASTEVIAELKKIAHNKEGSEAGDDDEDSEVEENVKNLYEEAEMPIEKVVEKYATQLKNLTEWKCNAAVGTSGSGSCSSSSSSSAEATNDGVSSTSSASEAASAKHSDKGRFDKTIFSF